MRRKYSPTEWLVFGLALALIIGLSIWGIASGFAGKREAENALEKAQVTISELKTEVKVLGAGKDNCKAQSVAYGEAATQFATFIVALDGGYAAVSMLDDGIAALNEGDSYECN